MHDLQWVRTSIPSIRWDLPIDWFTAFMHKFSYSSIPASRPLFLPLVGIALFSKSATYRMRSLSSTEPMLANGRPTMTTARARSSEKLRPSDSFAPTTAKRRAPVLPSAYSAQKQLMVRLLCREMTTDPLLHTLRVILQDTVNTSAILRLE